MTFLSIVILAYFLLAIAAIVDKLMVSGQISHPAIYAFFVGILNILVVLLIPFGFVILPLKWILVCFLSGIFLTFAILFFFTAMRDNDATRVVTFNGGASPIFTLILAYLFLGERFNFQLFVAFIILVTATVLISINLSGRKQGRIVNFHNLALAALFFSSSFFLSKMAFNEQPFLSVFIWSRIGSFLAAFTFLLIPVYRKVIVASIFRKSAPKKSAPILFFSGQTFGASGVFLLNYAISLGSVSLVNALQGVQQAFVLGLAGLLGWIKPSLLSEHFSKKQIVQKSVSVALIITGLYIVAVNIA